MKLILSLVTNEECINVIKQMGFNKSPGYYGLPPEFYRILWPIAGQLVLSSYAEAYSCGELGVSQCQSVLTLII